MKKENTRRDLRMTMLEQAHQARPKTLLDKVVAAAVIGVVTSAAVASFWLVAYVAYANIPGYVSRANVVSSR
jgi:hypothetical protein